MKKVQTIDLNLVEELRDQSFARRFFAAELSADIARQLIDLRKRRGLNQKQVAELANTKQPAISRAEQADYQNWSFKTLRAIADALQARIRVSIQPYEDVINEYDLPKNTSDQSNPLNYLGATSVQADSFSRLNKWSMITQKRMPLSYWCDRQGFSQGAVSTEDPNSINRTIPGSFNRVRGQYPELLLNGQSHGKNPLTLITKN